MTEQWKERINRSHSVNAGILASLYNIFRRPSAEPKSAEDFLPFEPPRVVLNDEESMAALDLFFGAIVKRNGAANG